MRPEIWEQPRTEQSSISMLKLEGAVKLSSSIPCSNYGETEDETG